MLPIGNIPLGDAVSIIQQPTVFGSINKTMIALKPDSEDVAYSYDEGRHWYGLSSKMVVGLPDEGDGNTMARFEVVNPFSNELGDMLYIRLNVDGVIIQRLVYGGSFFEPKDGQSFDESKVIPVSDARRLIALAADEVADSPIIVVALMANPFQLLDTSAWKLFQGTWSDLSDVPIESCGRLSDGRFYALTSSGGSCEFNFERDRAYARADDVSYARSLQLLDAEGYDVTESDGKVMITQQ